jgi:D-3-phosphoglycerate dehydrogenase / 2-oxoglutarate reductase
MSQEQPANPIKLYKMPYLVIDFDSTFISIESLDELFSISLQYNPEQSAIVQKIQNITNLGMEGKLGFAESLSSRVKLLKANNNHINKLVELLKTKISASFLANRQWLKQNSSQIYIISGGFTDYIAPVVAEFGIPESRVFANKFYYDYKGDIVDYDKNSFLARDKGKCKQLQIIKPEGEVWAVGDGWTDYELKQTGVAKKFFAYTENVSRSKVVNVADTVAPNLDTIIREFEALR